MAHRVAPAVIQLAVLGLWLGAAAFMSIAVAPALFDVLPTIFYSGMVVGVLVIAIDVWVAGAWRWNALTISSLAIAVSCAIAQWIVSPRIERVRAQIPGPIESLPLDDARRVAFGRLHGISVGWLGLAMLAAIAALVVCARLVETRSA